MTPAGGGHEEYQATLESLSQSVVKVGALASDPEGAHSLEDAVHVNALRWIARHGDTESRSVAAVALITLALDFERWCA